jgi:D-glycerate 3-kinase
MPSPGFETAIVANVLDDALAHAARIYGIGGLQGSGKSTLARQVAALARSRGIAAVAWSLDDAYLARRARRTLAARVHPLCAQRGVPGTHDVALACRVLDTLRAGLPLALPRFDKRHDTRRPPSRWPHIAAGTRLVVFEGWCLGVPPQDAADVAVPVNAFERAHDPDARWRRWSHAAHARDYPALWSQLDRLLFLHPPAIEVVAAWRHEQERHLRGSGRGGMDDAALARFLPPFERLSRHALATLPSRADAVLSLDAARRPRGWQVRER